MFGYATDETESLMPLTHNLATSLGSKLTEVRKNGVCPLIRPDGKTQVTVEYRMDNGRPIPIRVHTVVISTQHAEELSQEELKAQLMEHVIKPVIPAEYLDDKTIYHLNPSGRFVIGGAYLIQHSIVNTVNKFPFLVLFNSTRTVLSHIRSSWWCWAHRSQDHHWYLRWLGRTRWRSFLWKGHHKGTHLSHVHTPHSWYGTAGEDYINPISLYPRLIALLPTLPDGLPNQLSLPALPTASWSSCRTPSVCHTHSLYSSTRTVLPDALERPTLN